MTYLRNVVPHLSRHPALRATVAINSELRLDVDDDPPKVSFLRVKTPVGPARRFWTEQAILPRLIEEAGAQVLVSTGNFALRRSPIPQILLAGNALYLSPEFFRDLRFRRDYRMLIDTRIRSFLARRSVAWADRTVAPTRSFERQLRAWTGSQNVVSVHHGFDGEAFFRDEGELPADIQDKLNLASGGLRLLFVSHYNYYRNFETLLQAVPLINRRLPHRPVTLFLTCKLDSEQNPGAYRAEPAAGLVRQLGISNQVVELGAIPYHLLHRVYKSCDLYVSPAYAETFAHPLLEAMACGLPVVASDLPVHREVCGGAALYFGAFSAEDLAERVAYLATSAPARADMIDESLKRSATFSWAAHVDRLSEIATILATGSRRVLPERAVTGTGEAA